MTRIHDAKQQLERAEAEQRRRDEAAWAAASRAEDVRDRARFAPENGADPVALARELAEADQVVAMYRASAERQRATVAAARQNLEGVRAHAGTIAEQRRRADHELAGARGQLDEARRTARALEETVERNVAEVEALSAELAAVATDAELDEIRAGIRAAAQDFETQAATISQRGRPHPRDLAARALGGDHAV